MDCWNALIACCGCALCFLIFRAWRALYEERAWALWIARAWAALMVLFGALDLHHLYKPHAPSADEYFGIIYDPVLIFGGGRMAPLPLAPQGEGTIPLKPNCGCLIGSAIGAKCPVRRLRIVTPVWSATRKKPVWSHFM